MKCIIFDLSEVLIRGIVGVERSLAKRISRPEKEILTAFGGENLVQYCCGEFSEENYLSKIITKENWEVSIALLKRKLRENFLKPVAGMPELIREFSKTYELILLSDHGREWIEYIEANHKFLGYFKRRYYSFSANRLKTDRSTFKEILAENNLSKEEVIFIDDNPANVEAAKEYGIAGIVFQNREQLRKIFNPQK